MVYDLEDTKKAAPLFDGWQETLIYSCLQKVMGHVYVTDTDNPVSAAAFVGSFILFAGKPDRELVEHNPGHFVIMAPKNEEWAALIEECYPQAKRVTRYAIRKDTEFDQDLLRSYLKMLPEGYEIKKIDEDLYDKCLESDQFRDFVSSFENKEEFLKSGRGIVIVKNGEIMAGASSYSRYREGIEIEVDTAESERRKNLATVACSALILNCLEEGLYPSWDAQNMNSVRLSQKLGYEFDHEYPAYEVAIQD